MSCSAGCPTSGMACRTRSWAGPSSPTSPARTSTCGQALGVLLIAAITVIPAIVARLLTDSFRRILVVACLVGAACGFTGMYLSYYAGAASGATIVLVAAGLFVVVFALTAVLNRRRLARIGSELHADAAEASPVLDPH